MKEAGYLKLIVYEDGQSKWESRLEGSSVRISHLIAELESMKLKFLEVYNNDRVVEVDPKKHV